jgi:hypothetical protein
MSWIDNINNTRYSITTGDNKTYFPLFLNPTKEMNYNVSEYQFINLSGSLVRRELPKGIEYPFEFYFVGEDCVDFANQFDKSAENKNPWTVIHPFYGQLTVQPFNLSRSNTSYNQTSYKCKTVETITTSQPLRSVSKLDDIQTKKANSDDSAAASYSEKIGTPPPSHAANLNENATFAGNLFSKLANNAVDLSAVRSATGLAISAVTSVTTATSTTIRQIQSLINLPASFEQTVEARINSMLENYNKLVDSLGSSKADKLYFESSAASTITTAALATVIDGAEGYLKRSDVLNSVSFLRQIYANHLQNLDTISDNDYQPDHRTLLDLFLMVNSTILYLFDIVFDSKQEREVILDVDTNLILLTHKYYGIASDENIDYFKRTNDITINELIQIKKGRKIVYYV